MTDNLPDPLEIEGVVFEGFAFRGMGPIREGWLPLRDGLTVLYGLNGAGKSTVLRGIESVLTGLPQPGEEFKASLLIRILHQDTPSAPRFVDGLLRAFESEPGPMIAQTLRRSLEAWDSELVEDNPELAHEMVHQRRILISAAGQTRPAWELRAAAMLSDDTPHLTQEILVRQAHLRSVLDDPEGPEFQQMLQDAGAANSFQHLHLDAMRQSLVESLITPLFAEGGSIADVESSLPPLVVAKGATTMQLNMPAALTERTTLEDLNHTLREILARSYYDLGLVYDVVGFGTTPFDVRPLLPDGQVDPDLLVKCQELGEHATTQLRRFMPTPLALQPVVRKPNEWLLHPPVEWQAITPDGGQVPLANLSRAELRWATHSIASAHQQQMWIGDGLESLTFRLIDEPEAALHRTAETQMAAALMERSPAPEIAIVATHSPELLDHAAHVHLVKPAPAGRNAIAEWRTSDLANIDELGLARSDLLGRYKTLLAVEGPHEVWILDELMGSELEELRVKVLAMWGGKETPTLVNADFIMQFTDWRAIPMWDNIRAEQLARTWHDLMDELANDSQTNVRAFLEARIGGNSEAKFIRHFMYLAVTRGEPARFGTPFGLSKKDILHYLPPRSISLTMPETWERIWQRKANEGPNLDEKKFLRQTYGVTLDEAEIRAAVRRLDSDAIPREFTELLTHLQP